MVLWYLGACLLDFQSLINDFGDECRPGLVRLLRAIEFGQQLADARTAHLVVVIAECAPSVTAAGGVPIVIGTLDGVDFIEAFCVVNCLDQEVHDLFLNDSIWRNSEV